MNQPAPVPHMSGWYRLGWTACQLFYRSLFRLRFHHPDRVPPSGPVILASNHASFLDPPLIGIGLPREVNYLARKSLFQVPPFAWILHRVQAVPVDRDGGGAAGLKAILDRLQAGGAILLFPEGTRTSDGNLQPARSGIGLAVLKSSAPVVPVRVFGTFDAWGRHRRFPRPFGLLQVKYGNVLEMSDLRELTRNTPRDEIKTLYPIAADRIMRAIQRLQPCRDCDRFPRT